MESNFLKSEPIAKLLFRLGLPMVFSMLINSLYNIIDSMYVARLGTDAVTALSIIFPLQNLTVAVSVGLGVGLNSVIAREMGADNLEKAERAASAGVFLAVLHALIFFIIGLIFIRGYVSLYASPQTRVYTWSVEYGRIVLTFSLPYLLFLVFEKIFQSIGWMKTAMWVMIAGAVTNIILDPILIYGYFGLPRMGVSGAAIATVLAQLTSFLLFVLIYCLSKFPIRLHWKYMLPKIGLIKRIYTVAIPAAFTLGLPSLLVALLNTILIRFSDVAVAALGLYYKIQTFFYMPVSGLIQGMRPLVGYNYGAKEYGRVKKTISLSLLISIIILGIGTIILVLFTNPVLNLFAPDTRLRETALPALRIIAVGFIPSAFSVVATGAFEAFGLGTDSLIISSLRLLVLAVALAYILSIFLGEDGVWIAMALSEVITAIIAYGLLMRSYRKLRI